MQECHLSEGASGHSGCNRNHGLDGVGFSEASEEHGFEDGAGAKEVE